MHIWLKIAVSLIFSAYLWQIDFAKTVPAQSCTSGWSSSIIQTVKPAGIQVNEQNIKMHLSEITGKIGRRPAGTKAELATAEYCSKYLKKCGWEVHWQRDILLADGRRTVNLIAQLPETDIATQVVVLGVHLDSRGEGAGADDNGSGLAALLEIARIVKAQTRHSESSDNPHKTCYRLVFFGGEEFVGGEHHIGSRAYVQSLSEVQRAQIAGMISVDGIGGTGRLEAARIGFGSDAMCQKLIMTAHQSGESLGMVSGVRFSDHEAFEEAGIPAVWLRRMGQKKFWHTKQDTLQHVKPEAIIEAIHLVLGS